MIISEYLSNVTNNRNKKDKLTQIKGASTDEVYRVIRLGGSKLDCHTCNKRFFGGSFAETMGTTKVPIKQFPIIDASKGTKNWAFEPEQTSFPSSYSQTLAASPMQSVVRSAGTSQESYINVLNRDSTKHFASYT